MSVSNKSHGDFRTSYRVKLLSARNGFQKTGAGKKWCWIFRVKKIFGNGLGDRGYETDKNGLQRKRKIYLFNTSNIIIYNMKITRGRNVRMCTINVGFLYFFYLSILFKTRSDFGLRAALDLTCPPPRPVRIRA